MTRQSIIFTKPNDEWLNLKLKYLRDLVRRDQAIYPKFSALKVAITEGMESGISHKSVPDIIKEVEECMRADRRL